MSHPGLALVPTLPDWTAPWTPDPLVLCVLIASATVYTIGATRLWRHAGLGHGVRPYQAICHGLGLTVLAIALLSPLDRASDVLFSAHMAQHELLMLIAAPLIVLGKPITALAWALPSKTVRTVRIPGWRYLTHPIVAFTLHALARWLWHIPAAFNAALDNDGIHAVQHLMFFGTATLFWWALIHGRYGKYGYGIGVAFVFFTLIHSGLLAALLSLADTPLYEHGARTAQYGIDAVADQQRAGLLMWVPAGIIMMAIGLAIMAAWLGQSARRMRHSPHPGLR